MSFMECIKYLNSGHNNLLNNLHVMRKSIEALEAAIKTMTSYI